MRFDGELFHSIQLKEIKLGEMICKYDCIIDNEEMKYDVIFEPRGEITAPGKGICYLTVVLKPQTEQLHKFEMKVEYIGICEADENIDEAEFDFYLKLQSVPMLWAYIREAIQSNMLKMGVPQYLLPAINISELIKRIQEE